MYMHGQVPKQSGVLMVVPLWINMNSKYVCQIWCTCANVCGVCSNSLDNVPQIDGRELDA